MRTRVVFGKPGFFLADSQVELWIDQRLGFRGSFVGGFEVWATLDPGPHVLRTMIFLGPIHREKMWVLDVPPEPAADGTHLDVTLRYSRLWGNFKSKLLVAPAPG